MKYDWKKQEKDLYGAKQMPSVITVPRQSYIMISGKGNPNEEDFSNRVAALYSLAYAVKMSYKASAAGAIADTEVQDFAVYPLEGVWDQKNGGVLVKENLEYTVMIRQPDFVTESIPCLLDEGTADAVPQRISDALEIVKKKKPNPLYEEIRFGTMQDGKCIQILHIGGYDDEPASFEKMARFAEENGLERAGHCHREIYLNNPGRVNPSKLKTILRFMVK